MRTSLRQYSVIFLFSLFTLSSAFAKDKIAVIGNV